MPNSGDFEPSPAEIRKEFKVRGVNAWRAYQCCRNAHQRQRQFLNGIGIFLETLWENQPKQAFAPIPNPVIIERLLPEVFPIFRFVGEWKWSELLWGVTVAVIGEKIDASLSSYAQALAQLDPQGKATRALVEISRDARIARCYWCVKRRLWGQKKKRHIVRTQSRWDPDGKLELRTPHR